MNFHKNLFLNCLSTVVLFSSIAHSEEKAAKSNEDSNQTSLFTRLQVAGSEPDEHRFRICRRMLVGPWHNQPREYDGYNGFVGWSSVTRLKSGRWAVAFTSGSWHASFPWTEEICESLRLKNPEIYEQILSWDQIGRPKIPSPRGGRAHVMFSDDEGQSWSKPETLIDTELDDRHPTILELKDGTQLCMFFTYGWLPDDPRVSAGARWMRSEDGGKTWSKPMSSPGKGSGFSAGPAIQLFDGSVVWVSEGREESCGEKNLIFVYRSEDEGRTFEQAATVTAKHNLYEPTVAQLLDGRLVMMMREEGDICWSRDGGRTWTQPVSTGVRLFDPHLLSLPNGVLACFHGSYTQKRLRVILSPDGGQTWYGPGESYGYSVDPSVYGYSHPMLLPNGEVYLVYNHSGGHKPADARTQAIWAIGVRVHDDAKGIEIVPAPGSPAATGAFTNEIQRIDKEDEDPELGKRF